MADLPKRDDATIDQPPQERTAHLREQFQQAWQKALLGGPEPQAESYLAALVEPERSQLSAELDKLAHEYQRRRAACTEATQEETPNPARTATAAQSVTVDMTSELEQNNQTAEYVPPAKSTAADQAGTLDYLPEQPSGATTLERGPGAAEGSTSFSLQGTATEDGAGKHQVVAGYEILETLGRGAMGVVYKARQRGLKRVVALKMILAGGHASEAELARFRTEAEAVGQLQHANIVQVYEVGEHGGCPFLSLEYVHGGSLQKKLAATPQPVMHAAQMVQVLALAMDFAHSRGVIHRDLKPANVMLTLPRSSEAGQSSTISAAPLVETLYGVPKIADFGLAKRLEEDGGQTRSGTILGTPSYMAPEQAEGKSKAVGPLADQYALGALLYEMLTGRPPFRGESVWDTLEQVRTQEPVPPSQLQPKVPVDLETICLKALQKEPAKRYKDCAVLAEDLRRFVAGEPILARPVSAPERLWRWCRRNPKVAALAGTIAALLVAVAVGSTVFAFRLNEEKKRAEKNENEALRAKALATDQASLALDTVGALVSKVQERLASSPNTRDLREDIINMALEQVEKVDDAGKRNAGLDSRIVAAGRAQKGSILLAREDYKKAQKEYEDAYAVLEKLARENPQSDKARGNLAVALASLGNLKRIIDHDSQAARSFYLRALQLIQEIHDNPRSEELKPYEVKRSLASAYEKLAEVTADPAKAAGFRQKALELRKEVVDLVPGLIDAKRDLWKSYAWLGEEGLHVRDTKKAIANYEQCLGLLDELVKTHPNNRELKRELADVLSKLGEIYLRQGQTEKALQDYVRGQGQFETLLQDEPVDEALRREWSNCSYGLATTALARGDLQRADSVYRAVLTFWENWLKLNPKEPRFGQELIMLCAARCGDNARAVKIAEELRKSAPNDPGNLVLVACSYALCVAGVVHGKTPEQITASDQAQQKQHAVEAIRTLRQAKAKGYTDWALLETEPDLGPILGTPEFKKLLEDAKAPATAKN
jgi:eukaryotic-like serine/threonine-protein kinase